MNKLLMNRWMDEFGTLSRFRCYYHILINSPRISTLKPGLSKTDKIGWQGSNFKTALEEGRLTVKDN